jgi:flagellar motility protein MotE (MotC chaperone)
VAQDLFLLFTDRTLLSITRGVRKMVDLIKKILLVGGIGIVTFPIIYITMMIMDGQLRIEKGSKKPELKEEVEVMKYSPVQDSLSVVNSKTYESLLLQEKRLESEKRRLSKQEERIQLLDKELAEKAQIIEKSRKDIELVVKNNESLEEKRIRALAKIYAAMRPDEAAPILETLPDKLIVTIFKGITEDRQKAKILEKMDRKRAGQISKLMGEPVYTKKNKDNNS